MAQASFCRWSQVLLLLFLNLAIHLDFIFPLKRELLSVHKFLILHYISSYPNYICNHEMYIILPYFTMHTS